jgi:hypothetical protein
MLSRSLSLLRLSPSLFLFLSISYLIYGFATSVVRSLLGRRAVRVAWHSALSAHRSVPPLPSAPCTGSTGTHGGFEGRSRGGGAAADRAQCQGRCGEQGAASSHVTGPQETGMACTGCWRVCAWLREHCCWAEVALHPALLCPSWFL